MDDRDDDRADDEPVDLIVDEQDEDVAERLCDLELDLVKRENLMIRLLCLLLNHCFFLIRSYVYNMLKLLFFMIEI